MSTIFQSGIGTQNIIQTVQAYVTTVSSTNQFPPVATNLSLTITPKFSTSQIFLIASGNAGMTSGSNNGYLSIYRNATNLYTLGSFYGNAIAGRVPSIPAGIFHSSILFFWDSPATTSPIVYTVMITSGATGTVIQFGYGNTPQILTAMEIAQ